MAMDITLENKISGNTEELPVLDGTTVREFLTDNNIASSNVSVAVNDRTVSNLDTPLRDGDFVVVTTTKLENGASA